MEYAKSIIFFIVTALCISAPAIHADEKENGIEVKMMVHEEIVVTNKKGEKEIQLIEAASVVPGDIVVYTTLVENNGKEPADNVAIKNPIPKEIIYIENTASGDKNAISFSVDGGTTFGKPDELTVQEDGKVRAATSKDYTHIRWTLKTLNPAEKTQVSFHGKLK